MTTATADLQAHRLPCSGGCKNGRIDRRRSGTPDGWDYGPCRDCDGGEKWFVGFSERCPAGCDKGQVSSANACLSRNAGGADFEREGDAWEPPPTIDCPGCMYMGRASWLEPGRVGVLCLHPFHAEPGVKCPANCRNGFLMVEITREEAVECAVQAITIIAGRVELPVEVDPHRFMAAALLLGAGP